MGTLFDNEFENQAIERIRKFAKIAKAMDFDICLGFSGGKDSQVCYDLCKRAEIEFKAYFNHAFESKVTLNFIRKEYPEVIWRREYNFGFIENIWRNHKGMLPTVTRAYCCEDYKHNPKYVDKCSILGVRKAESAKRAGRTAFMMKNKTTLKKNKSIVSEYFIDNCQSVGSKSVIQLLPIIDWTHEDVWNYIYKHNLPINPEYKDYNRVGCVVCPKAPFGHNYKYLIKYPKIIDAFIKARERGEYLDWIIKSDKKDYSDNKFYYICRWLNHSFMPFTKKQEDMCQQVKEAYDNLHKNK